jgi:hypothetical protein
VADAAITRTEEFMVGHDLVEEAFIEVQDDEIRISLAVNAAITDEAAKGHLENATRFLASQVALGNEGLAGPSNESLGELWDHYTLQVLAGTSAEDVRVQGAKVPESPRISW